MLFLLYRVTGKVIFNIYESGGTTGIVQFDGDDLLDDEWHHVVVVVDRTVGNTMTVYLDGFFKGWDSDISDVDDTSGTDDLFIGTEGSYNDYPFNGLMDEVRIYGRALSADEVGELYRAGARKFVR